MRAISASFWDVVCIVREFIGDVRDTAVTVQDCKDTMQAVAGTVGGGAFTCTVLNITASSQAIPGSVLSVIDSA